MYAPHYTPQRIEHLYRQGLPAKLIAKRIGVTPDTVVKHTSGLPPVAAWHGGVEAPDWFGIQGRHIQPVWIERED